MQATVIGVSRMSGVGKTSKAAYDMAKVLILSPIKPFSKAELNISGYGFEVAEIPLAVDAVASFAGLRFPCTVDLATDSEVRAGKLQTVCTGIVSKAA